ncbi:MAG: hypothetical protein ABIW76_03105 [Fibrobacteria bacterium]
MKNRPWKRLSACLLKGFLTGLLTSLLTGLLTSCTVENEKSAGGATDVPNYLASIGPLVTGYIQASTGWGQAQNSLYDTLAGQIPMAPPQTGGSAAPKQGALSKASDLNTDSIRWDYADSAQGVATAYRHAWSGVWETRDTSLVRYDQHARAGNYAGAFFLRTRGLGQFNFLANVSHRYLGEDSDSDGVLDRRTNIVSLQWWGKTEQETWYTTDHPGKDLDFRTGDDNPVEKFEKVVTLGPDTLMHEFLEDRDGDHSLWTMPLAGIDSSRFIYIRSAPGALGSGVKRSEIQAIVVIYDSSIPRAMEVRKAFLQNEDFTGASHSIGMRGFRVDSTYIKGDSMDIVLAHAAPAPDSVAALELVFRVQTSIILGSQDALVRARVQATLRKGPIAEAHFLFRPDVPLVSSGAVSNGGSVSLSAKLASGVTVSLQGRYAAGKLTAEVTEAGGKPYTAVWDKAGKLLQGP